MPDPSYVVETQGREAGLHFHLTTAFYPPLPEFVKVPFVAAFVQYWDFNIDIEQLQKALKENAGYTGSLDSYNLWQFLNAEDLHEG